jgi:hypothetical protein
LTAKPSLLQAPIHWWRSLDRVQRSFLLLALVRVVIAVLFVAANVPPLDLRYRWYLHHGGDQQEYLDLARSLAAGSPRPSLVGLGQALVMVPWVILMQPAYYWDIIVPLVVINGFLLGGLSVPLMGGLARRITGRNGVAVLAALVWAVLPTLTYYGFFWHFDPVIMRSSYVPVVGWLNGLSDGPTTFILMIGAYLLARGIDENAMPPRRLIGFGLAMGAAVTFRFHVVPIAAFLFLYVLMAHGWRALGLAALGAAIAYLPQAWYNTAVFHFPVTTGYISVYSTGHGLERVLWMLRYNLPFHPRNWADLWAHHIARRMWLLIPLSAFLAFGLAAMLALWRRRGWQAAALLFGSPLVYLIPMTAAWPFRADVIRFSLPALPFLIIIGIYALAIIWQQWRCRGLRRARPLDIPSQG